MDILKMRASSYLLPDPGGEVVRDCLAEIERLNTVMMFVASLLEKGGKDTLGYGPALRRAMTSAQEVEK